MPTTEISKRERVLGGLWGSLVGDALGVPVEFLSRDEVRQNRVTGMRGHGTHHQPAGTWSDDSSLLLCSAESLVQHEFDTQDMGERFRAWYQEEIWTPHGRVFDVGVTTSEALRRISKGIRAELAGADGQFSNGNGSLMRILPVSLRFTDEPTKQLLDRVHRASAITHRHPRSQMACGLHALFVRQLLKGSAASVAFKCALDEFRLFYDADPYWAAELDDFQVVLSGDLAGRAEIDMESDGYVIHTLNASLWSLLTTTSFEECVLKAVNLGGDTDTTGCVAGGLAGVLYGLENIPTEWRKSLTRFEDVNRLFLNFVGLIDSKT
jgi:ADP-ribosyl-[dinitrogen reductase] hydrolase